jgi:hypothetical protein
VTAEWWQAVVASARATEELARSIAAQKPAVPLYVVVVSFIGAVTGAASLGWHVYQHFTRCPDFRFRDHRVTWFTVTGRGYPVECGGVWVGVQGQVSNKGYRAGSLLACRVESAKVRPADGQGCFPASFRFPQHFSEGGSIQFDALFHLSKAQVEASGCLPCTLIIERDRGRPQRYELVARQEATPNASVFDERLRSRRAPWTTDTST